METTKELVADQTWDSFVQAETSPKPAAARVNELRMNGNTGEWTVSKWDPERKERTEEKTAAPAVVVLATRYFVRWKFKKDAPFSVFSREFTEFRGEPVTLLKYDNAKKGEAPVEKRYADYFDLKDSLKKVDDITGVETHPYDFCVSLYVLVGGAVLNYRFKGDTRSNWFDYQKALTSPIAVVTQLGTSEETMPAKDGEEAKTYFAGTFANLGLVPPADREAVMKASAELKAVFAAWKAQRQQPEAVVPKAVLADGFQTPRLSEAKAEEDDGLILPSEAPF